MKNEILLVSVFLGVLVLAGAANATEACISCHKSVTPGIVADYQKSDMAKNGVTCLDCHEGDPAKDPSVRDHNGYQITPVVSPKYCEKCHEEQVKQFMDSKHAWTAFIGPLKPWYLEMKKQGKDPLKLETALANNPRDFIRRKVTPLYPDSGALKRAGILDLESYNHENQVLGCIECHGSYVIAKDGEILDGWPNVGVGRVNPDGSLGSCSACHTRHSFSKAEARKPETCGQCHLGPDHPQMEIYEESKHGNIFFSMEDHSFLEEEELTPENTRAPTCAVCHMSGFNGVPATHDVGSRLYWELQPKKSVPQWKPPSQVNDIVKERVPDEALAKENRKRMKKVCRGCHSPAWVDGYFESFDKIIEDYNRVYDYTKKLLDTAYEEGLIDKSNPIDEIPEVMYYYIWHHDGRRWRMGASMMAPDWTHWNGAVDALLDKLNMMEEWIKMQRRIKQLEAAVVKAPAAEVPKAEEVVPEKKPEVTPEVATPTPEAKGVCGPTTIAAIALLPLAGYAAMRRRKL